MAEGPNFMSCSDGQINSRNTPSDKKNQNKKQIGYFPEDIVIDILLRLPVDESLYKLRCVCKSWLRIITDPYFVYAQLNRTENGIIVRDQRTEICTQVLDVTREGIVRTRSLTAGCRGYIWASCNGLLLLERKENLLRQQFVCNPITKQFEKLPTGCHNYEKTFFCTIGFVALTKEYKVACFFFLEYMKIGCEILTLGSDTSWRKINELPQSMLEGSFMSRGSVMINGVLYWLTNECIASMDFRDETFHRMQPPNCEGEKLPTCDLKDMNGSLCLMYSACLGVKIDVWILKDSSRSDWVKLSSIDLVYFDMVKYTRHEFPACFGRGEIIILYDNSYFEEDQNWYLYNVKDRSMIEIRINLKQLQINLEREVYLKPSGQYPNPSYAYLSHINSLVSWKKKIR